MPRGPKPKGYIPLHTSIPPELDEALEFFTVSTGVAKASLIRVALAHGLKRLDLLPAVPAIPVALTSRERNVTE